MKEKSSRHSDGTDTVTQDLAKSGEDKKKKNKAENYVKRYWLKFLKLGAITMV